MVLHFGGNLLTVPKFLRFKKEQSELSWEKGVETFVGICLNNSKCYNLNHNIYCLCIYL
jgi:hypothetical protein